MSSYAPTNMPANTFLSLLDSRTDQDYVRVAATGKLLRINDLRNPVDGKVLSAGLASGVYEVVEKAYPRSFLLASANWEIVGIDVKSRLGLVRIDAASGPRYLSCRLNVQEPTDPCKKIFC